MHLSSAADYWVNTIVYFMQFIMAEPEFSLNNSLNTKTFCVFGIFKQWCDLEGYFLRYFHQFIDVNAIVCIIS